MARAQKNTQPLTTAQRLSSIVKSCRDIMRKDKGLNGDLDRLPMLTWIMFLKFLDDMEQIAEQEAQMAGKRFRPALEAPYRWRDWAAKPEGITGDELISFVNNEEAVRPDGSKGAGLFAYLRGLQGANGGDRRDVIATVFKGTINRMINGYLLRDVINKVSDIHFTSSDEIHTLGHLYESMLKEMRDAAGDSGEFYTPRPVVRFMVEVMNPRLGEVILDPACGTGGFLVESFKHLEKQCKTVEDRHVLQSQSIFGGEAKPLPYLLAQMNLVLHGLESPKIDPLNSLRFPLREIGDRDRVDIIMTNPPFGGEEERGILGNFPEDKQTSETALLFLQLIMRKLKRPGRPSSIGRGKGEGNLTTIVRLPNGVFDRHFLGWFMVRPVFWDDLGTRASGMGDRRRTLSPESLFACNIPLPPLPEQRRIVARIEELAAKINEALHLRQKAVDETTALLNATRRVVFTSCSLATIELQDVCSNIIDNLHSNPQYADSGVPCVRSPDVGYGTLNLEGALRTDEDEYGRRTIRGEPQPDDVVLVREGGGTGKCALVLAGQRFSLGQRVMMLRLNREVVVPKFFLHQLLSPVIQEDQIAPLSKGSASPHLNIGALKRFSIRLPPLPEQQRIAGELDALQTQLDALRKLQMATAAELDALLPSILDQAFKGSLIV